MSAYGTRTRPLVTVVATLAGGALGLLVGGFGAGQLVQTFGSGESGAWAALGAAVVGAAVGAVLGAGIAVALAFRNDPPRARAITVVATVLAGPVLSALIAVAARSIDQDWNLPPLWLAAGLVLAALGGRRLGTRGTTFQSTTEPDSQSR